MSNVNQAVPSVLPEPKAASSILVVDDEEIVLVVLREILSRSGYDVLVAQDSNEAIEQFERHHEKITAIMLDLSIFRMAGPENAARIREISRRVPILLSSGYLEAEATNAFAFDSPVGFIQKPYTADAILTRLRELVEKRC